MKHDDCFYENLQKKARNMKEEYIEDELTAATVHSPCRSTGVHISSWQWDTALVLLQRALPEAEKIK